MKNYFLIILFLFFFRIGLSSEITFKDKLINGKKNDFVVYEYSKMYSCISILDIDLDTITLEEITISKNNYPKNFSFKKWIENNYKNFSSWTIYKINLKNSKIEKAYSKSRNCHIDLKNSDSIFSKLLTLKLEKLKDLERKKIGPPPLKNEIDRRSNWNPKKILNGSLVKKANFDAFRSIWPNDGSEFSSKIFDIYFDDSFIFPYFLEISNGHLSIIIKAIDSYKASKNL